MNAKDLLYKSLDFVCFWQNDPKNFHLSKLEKGSPSYYRLLEIEALLSAFGLSKDYYNPLVNITYRIVGDKKKSDRRSHLNTLSNLEYFLWGEFLNDREYSKNRTELINKIIEIAREEVPHLPGEYFKKLPSISWMYNALIHYRKEIHKFTHFSSGFIEGFETGRFYAEFLERKVCLALKDQLSEIDDTLSLIIDPDQKEFSLDELKSKHKYPDVDLEKIELHWRIENY